jgi:hypothetical protein
MSDKGDIVFVIWLMRIILKKNVKRRKYWVQTYVNKSG